MDASEDSDAGWDEHPELPTATPTNANPNSSPKPTPLLPAGLPPLRKRWLMGTLAACGALLLYSPFVHMYTQLGAFTDEASAFPSRHVIFVPRQSDKYRNYTELQLTLYDWELHFTQLESTIRADTALAEFSTGLVDLKIDTSSSSSSTPSSQGASPAEPPPPSPQNSKRKRKSDKHKDSKSKDRRQDSSGKEEEGGRPTTAVVSLPMLPFELPPLPEVQVGTHLWLTWLVVLHMTLAVLVEQTRDPFCSLVAMVINVLFLALLLRAKALNDAMDEAVGALRAAQVKLALVMPSGSEKEHLQQLLALSKMSVIVENWEDLGLGLRIHIPFEGTVAINALLLMSLATANLVELGRVVLRVVPRLDASWQALYVVVLACIMYFLN